MEYRHLGKTGLKVSALSLGSWVTYGGQVGEEGTRECMTAAVEAGVNFLDTAEVYADGKAELVLGKVLAESGWKRSDLVIATTVFWGGKGPNDRGLSRKHIMEAIDASLERLQLEYVDIFFCHRPDPETPIEETVWAMTDLIRNGLVFYWGTSEWSAQQIMEAVSVARREHLIPPVVEQPQYHMFHRERVEKEYARLYDEVGLGTTIWSPLASGLLTGKYNDGVPDDSRLALAGYEWLRENILNEEGSRRIQKVRALTPLARELDCTMAQLALAWCLKNPHVSTVILGASKVAQVRENLKALGVADRLTPEVMNRIEEILQNRPDPVPNFRSP